MLEFCTGVSFARFPGFGGRSGRRSRDTVGSLIREECEMIPEQNDIVITTQDLAWGDFRRDEAGECRGPSTPNAHRRAADGPHFATARRDANRPLRTAGVRDAMFVVEGAPARRPTRRVTQRLMVGGP
jgi:hypothetical protein